MPELIIKRENLIQRNISNRDHKYRKKKKSLHFAFPAPSTKKEQKYIVESTCLDTYPKPGIFVVIGSAYENASKTSGVIS